MPLWRKLLSAVSAAALLLGLSVGLGERHARAAPGGAPFAVDLPLAPVRFAWSSPLAQINDLYAVKGTSDGARIWAVGAMGTIISLRGTQATLEASGTTADLYDIFVVAENDVWIIGERGTILHGDGKRWSPVRSGTQHSLYSIGGRSAQDLWIGGDGGTILRRDGRRWRPMRSGTKGPLASITACGQNAICALTLASALPDTYRKGPCKNSDGCTVDEAQEPAGDRILSWSAGRWSTIHLGGIQPRRLVSPGSVLWVLEDYPNLSFVRGGKLDDQRMTLPKDVESVRLDGGWAGSDTDGWLVGERCTQDGPVEAQNVICNRGAIWRFEGQSASLRPEVPPSRLLGVWAWSKTGAVAVGERGTIMHFDGGAWTAVSKPLTDVDLRGIWSVGPAGSQNTHGTVAFRTLDDGSPPRMAELTLPTGSKITWGMPKAGGGSPPSSSGDAELWLVGDCEALRAVDRAWLTFFPTGACEPRAATRKVLAIDSGDVWISPPDSGSSGNYWLQHWNGKAWTNVNVPSTNYPRDLWASRRDDMWIVAGRDAFHWDGRALTAAALPPGLRKEDQLVAIWGADAKNVWVAATSGGRVTVVQWDGARWLPSASFRLDQRPTTSDAPNLRPPAVIRSDQVALWGTSATDVWLAGPNGIVLRFDGSRWLRVATPTRYPLFGLGGTQQRVVAVGAAGTVLQLDLQAPARADAH